MVLRKRQYKNFSKESFIKDLKFELRNDGIFTYFNNEFKEILDHHAPIKQRKRPGKNKPNKPVSKEGLKLCKVQGNVLTKLNKKS